MKPWVSALTCCCSGLVEEYGTLAYPENYWFSKQRIRSNGSVALFSASSGFVRPNCFCECCDAPFVRGVCCAVAFWVVAAVAALESQQRDQVPDYDGDGSPGWRHMGRHVPYGLELQHLNVFFLLTYFLLSALKSFGTKHACSPDHRFEDLSTPKLTRTETVIWFTHSVSIPICLTSALIYFTCLWDNANHTTLSNVSYGVNAGIVLLDAWFSRVPYFLTHVVWSLAAAAFYVFVITPIYFFSLPSGEPHRYIYPSLDWSQPGKLLEHVLVYGLIHIAIYVVLCSWSDGRQHVYGGAWSVSNTRMVRVQPPHGHSGCGHAWFWFFASATPKASEEEMSSLTREGEANASGAATLPAPPPLPQPRDEEHLTIENQDLVMGRLLRGQRFFGQVLGQFKGSLSAAHAPPAALQTQTNV